ncbi:MAG: PRC-barrel domain-containing protein [Victivallaceae bacterium]
MRKNLESMFGFCIRATDGEIGKVRDFYFDDESWTVRYLVVQTGSWLLGRKVLISFASVKKIDCELSAFIVDLTCDQVRHCPDIDTNKPVSRQHEFELHQHYMLPIYWINAPGIDFSGIDSCAVAENDDDEESATPDSGGNQHLRSAKQVEAYLIHAVDGEIGHVKDFVVDLDSGLITHLIIDTRNLLAGRKVLLNTNKIQNIDWLDSEVYVDVSRKDIIDSPEFDIKKDL